MLHRATEISGLKLRATDGEIGKIKDIYFDDETWAIQYLVADTGFWLTGRKVLISPQSAGAPDWDAGELAVSLSKQQIEHSPPISEDQPVSRQAQRQLGGYYNWGPYWLGLPGGAAPMTPDPAALAVEEAEADTDADPHLRSLKEVHGYTIQADDGEVGQVDDFIVETDTWALRYMLVDTRKWLPGRRVLVSPAWISELNWARGHVKVDLSRDSIKNAPEFNPTYAPEREYESRLWEYYGFPPYW